MRGSRTTRQLGQASIDYLGAVLVVALLCAAAAVAIIQMRPGGGGDTSTPVVTRPLVPLIDLLGRRPHPAEQGGLRAGLRRGARAVASGPKAFTRGFVDAVVRDAKSLFTNPLGAMGGAGGGLLDMARDPVGVVKDRWDAGRAYVRQLRAMRIRDAYERLMYDLGSVGEDVVVTRGKRAVVKRVLKGRRPSTPRPNGSQPPDVTN